MQITVSASYRYINNNDCHQYHRRRRCLCHYQRYPLIRCYSITVGKSQLSSPSPLPFLLSSLLPSQLLLPWLASPLTRSLHKIWIRWMKSKCMDDIFCYILLTINSSKLRMIKAAYDYGNKLLRIVNYCEKYILSFLIIGLSCTLIGFILHI